MKRGYCGIGIERAKREVNLGTLFRSAHALGADFVFTIGARYQAQASDTSKAWRHLPYFSFHDFSDFNEHRPYDCPLVGVELLPGAQALESFVHPERALYLLGPEDGDLSAEAIAHCQAIVRFSSDFCLNVAAAGTVILYDRQLKRAHASRAERGLELVHA